MQQAIVLVLKDPNGQATSHMKQFCEDLQRKGVPVKGEVVDLDDNFQVVKTLGKWAKAVGLQPRNENGIPRELELGNSELGMTPAQEEGFWKGLRRELGPQVRELWKQVMYGRKPDEVKPQSGS